MHLVLQLLLNVYMGSRLAVAIAPYASHLPEDEIEKIAGYITEASEETKIDPFLIAAVMWHESGFRAGLSSSTDDHGLMQVHWQPTSSWLKGLTRKDLLDPKTNIMVGARELAWFKRYCRHRHDPEDHLWWGHYKWGLVVQTSKYGDTVAKRREVLSRTVPSQKPGT